VPAGLLDIRPTIRYPTARPTISRRTIAPYAHAGMEEFVCVSVLVWVTVL
jgi:hypothetical protein